MNEKDRDITESLWTKYWKFIYYYLDAVNWVQLR
jgi:hypothetical protein